MDKIILSTDEAIVGGLYEFGETQLRCVSKKRERRNHGPMMVEVVPLSCDPGHFWRIGARSKMYEKSLVAGYHFVFEEGTIWRRGHEKVEIVCPKYSELSKEIVLHAIITESTSTSAKIVEVYPKPFVKSYALIGKK